jgi:hypothetical protein
VVLKDALSGKKLWRKYVRNEKLIDYQEGIDFIQSENYQIIEKKDCQKTIPVLQFVQVKSIPDRLLPGRAFFCFDWTMQN